MLLSRVSTRADPVVLGEVIDEQVKILGQKVDDRCPILGLLRTSG